MAEEAAAGAGRGPPGPKRAPHLLVVMGVSGCGKSTVGSHLADKLGWKFYEGDDYHPDENKKKMAEGIPLNDQDRIPWLCCLHDILKREHTCGQNAILACSALKKMYRQILGNGKCGCESGQQENQGGPESLKILFVHLHGSIDLIAGRLRKRKGHFMPLSLLQSQFDTLEPPSPPESFITINLEKSISEIVSEIEDYIKKM
ncbi:probable gluconokinase isoform X1 [Anolis carolinensis]|uniref:Gluconokinase n=2 Tax=Anolis carolinensis TaxID=28377 RepID=G1KA38_ANOCA|nr:PREDICTED: probable gluconokinase isoform X1 [Anolis carolinensis]|eukprot:XP_003216515.1 PREDICTED: probable gluconokinase isoform X1 [Anolis carolinensis]